MVSHVQPVNYLIVYITSNWHLRLGVITDNVKFKVTKGWLSRIIYLQVAFHRSLKKLSSYKVRNQSKNWWYDSEDGRDELK